MKRPYQTPRPSATGFTLLELLVVIGLIIFLMSILVVVVNNALVTARENATKGIIKKIDGLLTARMEAFTQGIHAQNLDGMDRSSILTKKNKFKLGFPQTLKEAFNVTDTATDETASSEALYHFLINGESFGSPPVDADSFDANEIADTDGDSRPEFIDGWGRPLRFYRWPTRLIRPAPSGQEADHQEIAGTSPNQYYEFPLDPNLTTAGAGYGAELLFGPLQPKPAGGQSRKIDKSQPTWSDERNDPLAKDPDDPAGVAVTRTASGIQNFEHTYHTPDTWSTPLIISAGQDGILGLYETVDATNHGFLAQPNYTQIEGLLDNITNRKLSP